ncbi:MAG: hypothetical protein IKG75_05980, partial [Bacteroidaceae bacterium]|nr:hypothetical protein [Bacteroidaceae bacterium]
EIHQHIVHVKKQSLLHKDKYIEIRLEGIGLHQPVGLYSSLFISIAKLQIIFQIQTFYPKIKWAVRQTHLLLQNQVFPQFTRQKSNRAKPESNRAEVKSHRAETACLLAFKFFLRATTIFFFTQKNFCAHDYFRLRQKENGFAVE